MKAVDAAIKAQIVKAVNPDYLAAIQDRILGFTNITSLQMLQHLEITYGGYNRDDRKANEDKLVKPWDPAVETMEMYWKRVDDCCAYATAAGDPISDIQLVGILINSFEKTEVFPDYMKDWNKKPEADQTLPNLKIHFNAANKDRLRTITTQDLGYAGAATHNRNQTQTQANTIATIADAEHNFAIGEIVGPFFLVPSRLSTAVLDTVGFHAWF